MTYNYFPDLSLVEAKFSHGKTNQKYCPDLDKDTSLVWNFCARSSDVFSRGNQWWPRAMSAFFSGQQISSLNNVVLINCLSFQIVHAVVDIYGMANMVSISSPSSGTLSKLFRYGKNPRPGTWFLRTCQAKICQLGPIYTKILLSLKFETGSCFLKSI